MNQHYVPYFYLKNFSFNKESIYVFDKLTRKQFTGSLKNVASGQDFYNLEVGNYNLETNLSKVESGIAPILQRLLSHDNIKTEAIITYDELEYLKYFFWIQQNRTLESRIGFAQGIDHMIALMDKKEPPKIDLSETIKSTELKNEHLNYFQTVTSDASVLEVALNRNMHILLNETNVNFLSSDSPVIGDLEIFDGKLIGSFILPISPRMALQVTPKGQLDFLDNADGGVSIISDVKFLNYYNALMIGRCTRQLFSFDNEFYNTIDLLDKNPNLIDPRKMRIL